MYNLKIIEYEATKEIEYRFYKNPIFNKIFDDEPEIIIKDLENRKGMYDLRSANESMRRTKQAIYEYARSNIWEWFVTYTFNPQKIDSSNYDTVYSSIAAHMKYIRKKYCSDMKYIIVPELHADGSKFHFHALMSNIDGLSMSDSGKRNKDKIIYNISNYKLGYTTAIRIGEGESGRTANYVSKYITKSLSYFTKGRNRYLISYNLIRPIKNDYMMSLDDMQMLKDALKEKTTSAKVVIVNNDSYQNIIEYVNIKL